MAQPRFAKARFCEPQVVSMRLRTAGKLHQAEHAPSACSEAKQLQTAVQVPAMFAAPTRIFAVRQLPSAQGNAKNLSLKKALALN
jgi:hypothetical protein